MRNFLNFFLILSFFICSNSLFGFKLTLKPYQSDDKDDLIKEAGLKDKEVEIKDIELSNKVEVVIEKARKQLNISSELDIAMAIFRCMRNDRPIYTMLMTSNAAKDLKSLGLSDKDYTGNLHIFKAKSKS